MGIMKRKEIPRSDVGLEKYSYQSISINFISFYLCTLFNFFDDDDGVSSAFCDTISE